MRVQESAESDIEGKREEKRMSDSGNLGEPVV